MRMIIDTDPGVDDAIAILMALAEPSVEVVGLTTVGGNVTRAQATRNTLALLHASGHHQVRVAVGSGRHLSARHRYSVHFHGPGGLPIRMEGTGGRAMPQTAEDFMRSEITRGDTEVAVVALGPLSTLAKMEREDPGTLAQASNIVVMGGAVECRGNITPFAEFNTHSDVRAAREFFELGVEHTLADLAACRQVSITREEANSVAATTSIGQLALALVQAWFHLDSGRDRFEFYDPLAMALLLDPDIAQYRSVQIGVETDDEERRGETVVVSEPGPTQLADVVDGQGFRRLLTRTLGWEGLPLAQGQ